MGLQSVKHSPLHQRRRRRSTLAANCERDGGYISVETYLSDYGGDFDDIDDHPLHEHGGADEPEDLDSPSYLPRTSRASYLSICGPACADGYLAVESSYAVGRPSLNLCWKEFRKRRHESGAVQKQRLSHRWLVYTICEIGAVVTLECLYCATSCHLKFYLSRK